MPSIYIPLGLLALDAQSIIAYPALSAIPHSIKAITDVVLGKWLIIVIIPSSFKSWLKL